MATKDQLQNALKEHYGINKNISQALNNEECERLLSLLENELSAVKLIQSFTEKNSSLGSKNSYYSRMKNQAETKLATIKAEYDELLDSIKALEDSTAELSNKKKQLEKEKEKLESDIQSLSAQNKNLDVKVNKLTAEKTELAEANDELKKDNKHLKNLIDALKLRLAIDVKKLLQYEDSEIKKALAKWFKGIQG